MAVSHLHTAPLDLLVGLTNDKKQHLSYLIWRFENCKHPHSCGVLSKNCRLCGGVGGGGVWGCGCSADSLTFAHFEDLDTHLTYLASNTA